MASPTPFRRADMLDRLEAESFDVLVIGGGITGTGVALDAAARGLRTALVERDDFASGTSSKSSKLVHGGLRYLQQGEVRLVYQALHERERLRKNAPHLVKVLPFMIPILTKEGVVSRKIARAMGSAMWMYDVTGGWRIGKIHRRLKKEAAFAHLPTMPKERLASAYLYFDATVDDARLCLTVARTAAAQGAVVVNRCRVIELLKADDGRSSGAVVDCGGGRLINVRAKVIVNASGVWSDEVRELDEGADPDSIRPAKGIHITVPWEKIRNDIAVVIPVPKDKRAIFVVPWAGLTYIGTTDTDYEGPNENPPVTREDVDYLLGAIKFTGITDRDVVGTWAGLRPLVKSAETGRTADLSRRHKVIRSASGVVSVTGGKLTTYREMAADTVDEVIDVLGRAEGIARRSRTKNLRLRGAEGYDSLANDTDPVVAHLANRYGGEARTVLALAESDPSLREPLVAGLPYLRAEAVYAARHEMARTVDDVLSCRTRARLLARDASAAAADDVARLIAPIVGLDDAEAAAQAASYRSAIVTERTTA